MERWSFITNVDPPLDAVDRITDHAGPSMFATLTNVLGPVTEWERVHGAETFDDWLAGWPVLAEAASPEDARFRAEIRKVLKDVAAGEDEIRRRTVKAINNMRNDILANIKWEAVTEWDQHRLAQLQSVMDRAADSFVDEMRAAWGPMADRATALGLAAGDNPMAVLGMVTDAVPVNLNTRAINVMGEYVPRLIRDTTETLAKRVRREAAMVMSGTKRPAAARAAIGGLVGDLEVATGKGTTYMLKAATRANNIMRTEFNRIHSMVATERIDTLADDAGGGVGKKWLHRRSNQPRNAHAALNGTVIWPAEGERFNVNGHYADGPHDPNLPAAESINCHCYVVVHVDVDAFRTAYKPPDQRVKAKRPTADPKAYGPKKATGKGTSGTKGPAQKTKSTAAKAGPAKPAPKAKPKKPAAKAGPATMDNPAVSKSIRGIEDEIIGNDFETLGIVDGGGNVLLKKPGAKSSVTLTDSELDMIRGNVVTHNHPGGSSFSMDDIFLTAQQGGVEIRAVGTNYFGKTYRHRGLITRPAGMGDDEFDLLVRTVTDRHQNVVWSETMAEIQAGKLGAGEANAIHYHRVWTAVANDPEGAPWFTYIREFVGHD